MNTIFSNPAIRSAMMERFDVDGATIEYEVHGQGEPVLLVPLALIIDGLGHPLLARPELASHYQIIHYHRRGYLGSTLGAEPLTIERQAADAAALLRHLGVKTAHIAGHSIGGSIALQLAVDAPELVHSLALLEPALGMIPGGQASLENLFRPMLEAYRSGDKQKAMQSFADFTFGPDWPTIVERAVPGGAEEAIRDFDTFIPEMASVQAWQFGPAQIAAIRQPVLSVLGVAHSNPFMEAGRRLLHEWFPQTEDCDIPSTHLLQMQAPQDVARGLADFFSRHPVEGG